MHQLTNTQEWISAPEAGPRKLGDLDRNIVALLGHKILRLRDILPNDRVRRRLYEVVAEDLRYEGERARRAQVALNDLELRLLAVPRPRADDLHVERARDFERLRDLLRDLLNTRKIVLRHRVRREDEGGVAGVHAGVLDVFGHGVDDELAFVRDRVDVELLGALNEFADDDRVQRRDRCGRGQVVLKRRFLVNDVHRRAGQDVRRPNEHRVPWVCCQYGFPDHE